MREPPKIKRTKLIAQTRIFGVEEMELEFSNGVFRIYERLKAGKHGAVMILPLLDKDTMLLIKEYAAGVERYELAFPKGLVDAGESSEQAANRELQEEVGYAANHLQVLRKVSLAPGYLSHQMDIVVAEGLYPSKLEGDEPEPIEVVEWKINDIDKLLKVDEFSEARSIAALYLLKDYLAQL
ncbi:ADP compounds hydrolase NudE [Kangiella koreensis]|uniref:NUDIX hydrolase n=1 Tax=Kangiella koreensis (strain DSM 16069 / JCM 12317 / KCTC 12182 / SW-125) TaxID=523791 RepID=C7R8E8_KANKD|nr:ADP compounds hydrolase NudE [Kangiella koreensis]ACV27713.1 NUDIX hydrolase [Kangiella koreensis DSM 16069]